MKAILTILLLSVCSFSFAQRDSAPAVPDYGAVYALPDAKQPEALAYKVVIDITALSGKPKYLNDGLFNLARFMNLHATGGLNTEQMEVVAVLHGDATFSVLDNKGYDAKYGMDNPNMELVEQLKAAGVDLYVCGQSLMIRNNGLDNINPAFEIALSAMTVVTEFQGKGYSVLKFD